MAGFKVTRISEGPVKPASATPEETLPLAWVDRYPTHRGLVESMHIFRSGAGEAPAVIRAALAKALAFFYPLVNNDFIASVVFLKAPLPLDGTRMLASCVTKEHSEEFARGMKEDLP
ncbi:HXXXD-type acyl-transferase family protein [Zea mays]|uniref:HXXXD-type acyl-transferase family protein n=1 Tax=Zea mays TaxID=4577 RepID=A0A1D6MI21_MAIZE|nr:HXXXD-type acyl-transferase family protein [Zea mays]